MNKINELQPHALWNNFSRLNAIPRASKNEAAVIQFMVDFGNSLGLQTQKDEIGNVIIKKPATAGMENKQTVCLQSHLDMVHQKNADTDFDFAAQGINMLIDGDWVKAKGTTLGADNGIGVAAIMTILESSDIQHPAIEALFTIDEETGLTGALGLKAGLLNADIMLNLDTEEDDELTIGCAGGIDVSANAEYVEEQTPAGYAGVTLTIKGLQGGHSGMDIHKGRGNANKLINRLLLCIAEKIEMHIHSVDGGGLRNAIPRESVAVISIPPDKIRDLKEIIGAEEKVLQREYASTDPNLSVVVEESTSQSRSLGTKFQSQLLGTIAACPNGIYRMSPEIPGLVQTSNNLARVQVKDGKLSILCLTRSSVDSEKMDLARTICLNFELAGATGEYGGSYPGWAPKPDAPVVKLMSELYKEKFKGEPHVNAVHAGLECGIIGKNYPAMQMISFGPNITGAHSPDEKVQVSSVQKFWPYLLDTLQRIPAKN